MTSPFLSTDSTNKVSETETHVFFLKGPFSQWHPSKFWASFRRGGESYEFNCAEQYMMAAKADLFKDRKIFDDIMATQQGKHPAEAPKRQKELGRMVANFDPKVWDAYARQFVFIGNWKKFMVPDMRDYLEATGDKILVEGAHYDPIWGVGLAWDDPLIIDPTNWRGTNWLGETLMRVRAARREVTRVKSHMSPYCQFDPFEHRITDAAHGPLGDKAAETRAEISALKEAMEKALMQISGGLCYFKAEAKHAQLQDAERTLKSALGKTD